jgi:hypothetical protein
MQIPFNEEFRFLFDHPSTKCIVEVVAQGLFAVSKHYPDNWAGGFFHAPPYKEPRN